jgi:hypothetical protein
MKELKKGENYYNSSGRLYSREHRVSFIIPKSDLIRSARMISNRKLGFEGRDKQTRSQVYLKANQPVNLWVDSDLYHLGKMLRSVGNVRQVDGILYKEFQSYACAFVAEFGLITHEWSGFIP